MQRSPTNTGECKGEIFSLSFFFYNTAVQQAVEWLLCRNVLILSFSGFKQSELTIGCLKAEIKEKNIWAAFHVVCADIWKDRGSGSAYQGDREHLTLKRNKIPAELCIHSLPMHDELLAFYF